MVNADLLKQGVRFVMDNYGTQFIPWESIKAGSVVIIPAFGTTIEIENMLKKKGVDTVKYNTTCPFVERVWNRAEQLGKENFTVVIHGQHRHEETRATFSHAYSNAPAIIVRDIEETRALSRFILGETDKTEFERLFKSRTSFGFNPDIHLNRIGVVNQTTMLASETELISGILRQAIIKKYGADNIKEHFADTRDTLCYATNDNQQAIFGLLAKEADLLVIGGYNSSNTTHLVELLKMKFPTYFISSAGKIVSHNEIHHFDITTKEEITSVGFLPAGKDITIAVTSGASCPDSLVEEVLHKILSYYPSAHKIEDVIN
jgi:4-hydroxy-3-methylbut-2-en-1-yl diphosphate reductase